jgi:ubiquinone/menaquinone biosynthesis C-methylase UbiE
MSENQPDWNVVAERFDLWLPYIAPANTDLLAALDPGYGETILDVACGTGEPALTLARRVGDAKITAVDAAEGMLGVARKKAENEGLTDITFECMPAEQLTFPDNHFDAVSCRFGVMLFDDPAAGLKQIQRVLKPGGRYALAVWGPAETQSSFKLISDVIDPLMEEGKKTPLAKISSLGAPGGFEDALKGAGFNDITVTRHDLIYRFKDFSEWWELLLNSAVLSVQIDALSSEQLADVTAELERRSHEYLVDGTLLLPHTYLVAGGTG